MTARDRRVLDAIRQLIHQHGYSPSYREIGDEAGVGSVGDVAKVVKRLAGGRYVTHLDGQPRTVRITSRGMAHCPPDAKGERRKKYLCRRVTA